MVAVRGSRLMLLMIELMFHTYTIGPHRARRPERGSAALSTSYSMLFSIECLQAGLEQDGFV